MNKNFKNGILSGVAMVAALFLNSACSDEWDKHYDDKGVNSTQTLLEIAKSQDDLSDFCEVIEACGCADSLLNTSRVYTLWAPVNGTFDKDSLLNEIQNGNRDNVLVRFVEGHMTNYIKAANGVLDNTNNILLLNKKVVYFEGAGANYTFDGIPLKEINIRASNGILHKISDDVYYAANIWEYIAQDERIDSLSNYIYSFNIRKFEPTQSIEGPTVNGEVTYLDSVFSNNNMWLKLGGGKDGAGFGPIDSEDSTYIFVAPTNDVWKSELEKNMKFYNYARTSKMTENELYLRDSLQNYFAHKNIVNHLVFSEREQDENCPDSLYSTFRAQRRRFAKSDIWNGVIDEIELSNGKVLITEKYPFSRFDTWHDTIKLEAERIDPEKAAKSGTLVEISTVTKSSQNDSIKGSISGSTYMVATYERTSSKPQIEFTIPNVLSGSYYVSIVMVPSNIDNMYATKMRPNKLRVTLKAQDADGKTVTLYATPYSTSRKNAWFENNPVDIDTINLCNYGDIETGKIPNDGERVKITFPTCEYGLKDDDYKVKLTIENILASTSEDTSYDRTMRIDCIILEPVLGDDE